MIKIVWCRDKVVSKGKVLSAKEAERLARNETKFEEARVNYSSTNEIVIEELRTCYRDRFVFLDPIFECTVKVRVQTKATATLTDKLTTLTQNARLGTDGGGLFCRAGFKLCRWAA